MKEISPTDAQQHLEENSAIFLDVRRPEEIAEGKIPGAKVLVLSDLTEEHLEDIGLGKDHKKDMIIVNCKAGGRSSTACKMMTSWGYTNTHNLTGGFDSWQEAGFEVETP